MRVLAILNVNVLKNYFKRMEITEVDSSFVKRFHRKFFADVF